MWLEYSGKGVIRIDDLSAETSLKDVDNGLTCRELVVLASKHTLLLAVAIVTVEQIRAEIDASRPVLCLISYAAIPDRQNLADVYGHFIMVADYDADNFYAHDPDFWGVRRSQGIYHKISNANFAKAIRTSPAPYQSVIARQ